MQQLKSQAPLAPSKQSDAQHADPVEVVEPEILEPSQPEVMEQASESVTAPQPEADVPLMAVGKEEEKQPEDMSQEPAPMNGNAVQVEQAG